MNKFDSFLSYLFNGYPKNAPEQMDQHNLNRNTNALLGILNRIQFDGELENYAKTPKAKEAIKDFEYSNITVPFGYENQDAFVMPKSHGSDLVRGARTPPAFVPGFGFKEDQTIVPGQVDHRTLTHEALHNLFTDRGMFPNRHYEEQAVRNEDYLNAVKNKDMAGMSKAAHYIVDRYGDKKKKKMGDPRGWFGLFEILNK